MMDFAAPRRTLGRLGPGAALFAACMLSAAAMGQSSVPAVFVSNNGNLEGSVTALRLLPDRSLEFVQKLVLGETPSLQQPVPGTNAYAIDISPNGRWLMVSHTTSNQVVEQLSLIEIHDDATLSLAAIFQTPDSPLDLKWVRDDLVAVTQTQAFGFNSVRMYAFEEESLALSLVNFVPAGSFCSSIAIHPSGDWLIAQDSFGFALRTMSIAPNGTLALASTTATNPNYVLGLGVSPDGDHVYGGGGISNGGKNVIGFAFDATLGAATPIAASPFLSPGSSPKQVAITGDGAFAAVAHGTDATIRTFARDPQTGALSATGFMFDVGVQGSLGAILVRDDLLLATDRDTIFDGQRGVYSFTIESDGSLTQNGPLVDTTGIGPEGIALWLPGPVVFGDLNGDGVVDGADLGILLQNWGSLGGPADLNGDGVVDGADLGALLTAWSGR